MKLKKNFYGVEVLLHINVKEPGRREEKDQLSWIMSDKEAIRSHAKSIQ